MNIAAPLKLARRRAAMLLVPAMVLLPGPAVWALHFRDGPPVRVTGGFGEDSCLACHSGRALNEAEGRLTLSGMPERFTLGETYEMELALSRPGMAVAGFQLAVRQGSNGAQAGQLRAPAGSDEQIGLLDERGVQFAHHRRPEAAPADGDAMRWKLSWTAPDSAAPVVVHAAAVAADGDDSELGDYVYTLELAAEPD